MGEGGTRARPLFLIDWLRHPRSPGAALVVHKAGSTPRILPAALPSRDLRTQRPCLDICPYSPRTACPAVCVGPWVTRHLGRRFRFSTKARRRSVPAVRSWRTAARGRRRRRCGRRLPSRLRGRRGAPGSPTVARHRSARSASHRRTRKWGACSRRETLSRNDHAVNGEGWSFIPRMPAEQAPGDKSTPRRRSLHRAGAGSRCPSRESRPSAGVRGNAPGQPPRGVTRPHS